MTSVDFYRVYKKRRKEEVSPNRRSPEIVRNIKCEELSIREKEYLTIFRIFLASTKTPPSTPPFLFFVIKDSGKLFCPHSHAYSLV